MWVGVVRVMGKKIRLWKKIWMRGTDIMLLRKKTWMGRKFRMWEKSWLRKDMCSRHKHVSCFRVVRDWRRVGNGLLVDWLVVIIRKIMEYIAWVTMKWRKTLRMRWVVFYVIWHFGFVCGRNVIMRSRSNIGCRS